MTSGEAFLDHTSNLGDFPLQKVVGSLFYEIQGEIGDL